MSTKYAVTFAEFTAKHYIQNFVKQHSELRWKLTATALRALCANAEESMQGNKLMVVVEFEQLRLCELDFAVAGTGLSPRASGCRAIALINKHTQNAEILLVYHVTDIVKKGNETDAWKRIIADNYPYCAELVKS